MWLQLLNVLLGLTSQLTEYLKNKQLLDAGEAKAIAKGLKSSREKLHKVITARKSANDSSVSDDPNNRDTDG